MNPPLISALLQPAVYPHAVQRVELLQTHGAWVLLAGEHAYKIKKPVRFSFMDFGSLAQRRAACEAEVRVNRRFESGDPAAHIYLEALPITGSVHGPRWGGDPALAIEWAVHMKRFDETGRLDHLCARGALTPALLESLARQLAAFQDHAGVAPPDSALGQPDAVMAFARDNFQNLRTSDAAAAKALSDWTDACFSRIAPTLAQRHAQGRVREGHGDLHLANLVLIGDAVVPFDAIEFNDALRWIDVASDIAFTWMDLRHQGAPGLANVLFSAWLDASGDVSAPLVLPFFAVYRALVRAKVAALRLEQVTGGPSTGSGRTESVVAAPPEEAGLGNEVRAYLRLAQNIAQPPTPRLLITHGLSGSGKTFASTRWLAEETTGRALRLRSDVERKRLHGLNAQARSGSGLNSGLYSATAHIDTYARLLSRSEDLLRNGWSVIVDAAFLKRAERHAFAALATRLGLRFGILACEAPLEQLRQRIAERQAQGHDASEATLAVLEQQLGWLEPLNAAERLSAREVL
jgi:aminoglycoside phosphotransferase family enzyme/predicted kinase